MQAFQLSGSLFHSDKNLLLNHREIRINEGVSVNLTTGFSSDGIYLEKQLPLQEHQAVLNFCIKGKQLFQLTGNYLPAAADQRNFNMILLPKETFTSNIETQGEIAIGTVYFGLSRFLGLLSDTVESLPKNFLLAAESQNLCYFKNHNWHPKVRQLVMQMLAEQFFSPVAGRLFLESKTLELIAVILELGKRGSESIQFIPAKDIEKIHHAREILESDLANPPSLSGLARMIGSNEFTLKKGFKAVFGAPVYRFLQKIRMEKAAELLQQGDMLVGEVALTVGYENFSAFSRAFHKEYKILPSHIQKTPFRHI